MSVPAHSFPQHFSPDDLKGRSSQHHSEREDLFQQLAGELLQLQYPGKAHVSATRGRDGSIDIYVDVSDSVTTGLCEHLTGPVIVECKDHEKGPNTVTNIRQGWAGMEKKLQKQAEDGWQNHFSPWLRTKSYLYCISANITQSLRDELQGKIETFFQTLPEKSRPPIEQVRIVDWSNLRLHLDSNSKLIDAWLGINHSNIATHQELLKGFSGFRSLLCEETLRFIELDKNAPFNPHRLYERLEEFDTPKGVLLMGVGGIGKSRTTIEVATLAERAGWRVLHILPGEPAVATEDIAELLTIDNSDTLLVFDYLEQATLDFQTLSQRVLSRAHRRKQRVRLFATARPNTLKQNPPRDQLFKEIEMTMDGDQQQRLTQTLVPLVAPTAVGVLGLELILTTCGHRPIIAVIIARDLERLARENTLKSEQLGITPPGDLLARLRAQLDDHQLTANPASSGGLLQDPPKPDLILAATILAATPFIESFLAEAISSATDGNDATARSQRVITHLKTLGWLDTIGNTIYSAHDMVTDEMLQRVFWDIGAQFLHTEQFQQLLTPLLGSARLLGRFAIAFSRLQGGPFRDSVTKSSALWLSQHAEALGSRWADTPTDESAYAIGAALDYPEWADQLVRHWDAFIQPWLHQHSEELAARHLLYRGLKALPEGEGYPLIVSGQHWLTKHNLRAEASYVLAPLLGRNDLDEQRASTAIDLAIAWLDHEDHARSPEAQFVLHSLLGRNDLGEQRATATIDLAIAWLDHEDHARSPEASYLLAPLLGRNDLDEQQVSAAIDLAMAWLNHKQQATATDADFVLRALLERKDLTKSQHIAVRIKAIQWLSLFPNGGASSFILKVLLVDKQSNEGEERVFDIALTWLDTHHTDAETEFVLKRLLRRRSLNDGRWQQTLGYAIKWLTRHTKHYEYPYVLSDTLIRGQCLSTEQRNQLIREAEVLLSNPSKLPPSIVEALAARLETAKSGKPLQNTCPMSADKLLKLAYSDAPPSEEVLQQGLDAIRQRLQRNNPASAGYFVLPLLALSHRVDNAELRTSILAVAKQVVSHPEMQPTNIYGMRSNAFALLGNNAWPASEFGRADLVEIGLLD